MKLYVHSEHNTITRTNEYINYAYDRDNRLTDFSNNYTTFHIDPCVGASYSEPRDIDQPSRHITPRYPRFSLDRLLAFRLHIVCLHAWYLPSSLSLNLRIPHCARSSVLLRLTLSKWSSNPAGPFPRPQSPSQHSFSTHHMVNYPRHPRTSQQKSQTSTFSHSKTTASMPNALHLGCGAPVCSPATAYCCSLETHCSSQA